MRYKLQSLVLLTAFATVSQAAIISGKLNFAGDVRVTSNTIDFLPVGPPDGTGFITTTLTGDFMGLAGTSVQVKDIVAIPPGPVDPDNEGNGLLFNFSGFPGLRFDISNLPMGNIPGTPFTLTDGPFGAQAFFSVSGRFDDGAGNFSNGTGIFSTQFTGQSAAEVLGMLAANGFVENSFSATFIAEGAAIPEPGTATMAALAGLLFTGASVLRRKLKA